MNKPLLLRGLVAAMSDSRETIIEVGCRSGLGWSVFDMEK
jgi:hypothetical protein